MSRFWIIWKAVCELSKLNCNVNYVIHSIFHFLQLNNCPDIYVPMRICLFVSPRICFMGFGLPSSWGINIVAIQHKIYFGNSLLKIKHLYPEDQPRAFWSLHFEVYTSLYPLFLKVVIVFEVHISRHNIVNEDISFKTILETENLWLCSFCYGIIPLSLCLCTYYELKISSNGVRGDRFSTSF